MSNTNSNTARAAAPDDHAMPESMEPAAVSDDELLTLAQLRDAWDAQADAANCWDALGIDEIVCWAQKQALARWGQQAQPQPAAIPPPTRRQLMMLASDMGMASIDEAVMKFALAALALWGYPAAPHPAPVAWCRSDDFLAAEAKRQSFSGWREQHRDCDMALYITKPPVPEIPEEIRLAFAELERKEQSLRDFRSLRESLAADRTCRPAAPPAPLEVVAPTSLTQP